MNSLNPEKDERVHLTVFAPSYGVLRYMSGMGGLAFSK